MIVYRNWIAIFFSHRRNSLIQVAFLRNMFVYRYALALALEIILKEYIIMSHLYLFYSISYAYVVLIFINRINILYAIKLDIYNLI